MTKLLLILPHTTELNSYLATKFKNQYKQHGIELLPVGSNHYRQIQKTTAKVAIIDKKFYTLEIEKIASEKGINVFVHSNHTSLTVDCFENALDISFGKMTYYKVDSQYNIVKKELSELDLIHTNSKDYFIDIKLAKKHRLEKIQSRISMCKNNIIQHEEFIKNEQVLLSKLLKLVD